MSTDCKVHKCVSCDYESKWKANMLRHCETKHTAQKVHLLAQKVHFPAQKVHDSAQKVHFPAQKVHFSENIIKCDLCNAVFKKNFNKERHMKTCKGEKNTLECEYCHHIYATKSSKSNHLRVCKIKKEVDSQALILFENKHEETTDTKKPEIKGNTEIVKQEADQIINTNNGTVNNGTINNTNNSNSNNNIVIQNIVVYDPQNMELLNDHISKKDFKKMINNHDFAKILTDYSTALLGRSENQCVRKTNLRSTSSAIHVGNDKWEYQPDKEVLPKLLSNIAVNFGNITQEYKVKIMNQLDTFIEDVTCEATDCHEDEDEETRLKALYKRTVNSVKHLLFNLTKRTLLEKASRKKLNKQAAAEMNRGKIETPQTQKTQK
jgi:hypothetical protein